LDAERGEIQIRPGPAPRSQTLKIEAWGDDGVKYTSDGIDAEGKPTHSEVEAKYDGKFYPFKGNPDSDMLAYKRIDVNTLHMTSATRGQAECDGHDRHLEGRQDADADAGRHERQGPEG
jgi:hypothetical protein